MEQITPISRRSGGFTLVELLVVMFIMMIIMGLVIPSMTSVMENNRLNRGGQLMIDQLRLARQTASSTNRTVELRLIRIDPNSAYGTSNGLAANGYNAVQLWSTARVLTSEQPDWTPVGPLTLLPAGIVVAENTTLSKALSPNLSTVQNLPQSAGDNVAGMPYIAFQMHPSGLVTPSLSMSDFFLTVVYAKYGDAATFPKNFITVQINSATGTPVIYRP